LSALLGMFLLGAVAREGPQGGLNDTRRVLVALSSHVGVTALRRSRMNIDDVMLLISVCAATAISAPDVRLSHK
jgi:hypothetical protein